MNGKSKLHIRPRCVGIMSSRVRPSLSWMLRCCHQSVINITVLAPWQTTHSVKLDTISDLNKQMNCCIWIHFVMYNPHCYIPKCICAEVCYKHHHVNTGGEVINTVQRHCNEHHCWWALSGTIQHDGKNVRCDHLCTWTEKKYNYLHGIMSSIV